MTTRGEVRQRLRQLPEVDRMFWLVSRLGQYTLKELDQAVLDYSSKGYVPEWDDDRIRELHDELHRDERVKLVGHRHGFKVWQVPTVETNPNWLEDFRREQAEKRKAEGRLF